MPKNDAKETLGAAIVAAAERNYVDFKNSLEPEVEDRFKTAVGNKVAEFKATMFGGKYEPETDEEDENLNDEEEEESEEESEESEEESEESDAEADAEEEESEEDEEEEPADED